MDMVKRHVREGRYEEAAAAAQRASVLLQDRKSRWTAWVYATMPRAVGGYLGFRESVAARKRKRDAGSNGNLKTQDGSVQLQSEELRRSKSVMTAAADGQDAPSPRGCSH